MMWLQKAYRGKKYLIIGGCVALILIIALLHRQTVVVYQLKEPDIKCKRPDLPVFAPEMMKFVKDVPPINCSEAPADWVVCQYSQCKVVEKIEENYGPIKCSFTDLIRVNETDVTNSTTTNNTSTYDLEKSDVVQVNCTGKNDTEKWSSVLTGIRHDNAVFDSVSWDNVPDNGFQINVLMLGFNSLSKNTFIRKLPKSYKYMVEVLGSHVLNGYNIVGDGSSQAIVPILTGRTELELPDTRKRLKNTAYLDTYPFIWKDFQNIGYTTAYFEDEPYHGVFTHRLNGFKEQPTHHYLRNYYLAAQKYKNIWPKFCSGPVPKHKVMFEQIKNFYKVYESSPKFLFAFYGELCHEDYNLIGAIDDDLLQFLKDIHKSEFLNNTILMIMSDHGHRYADVRNSIQGKLEERLPFMSFTFPQTFKIVFSAAYDNFLSNINKLTTPFDIYATFKSLIEYVDIPTPLERGQSLFTEISPNRTCIDADIEPHWCTCLDWIDVPLENHVVQKLKRTLEDTLNEFTDNYRSMCYKLSVAQVLYVTKLRPNEDLIKFAEKADYDGFIPDLSAKTKVNTNIYQIKAVVIPGDSIYEASIRHNLDKGAFKLEMKDISRINTYGSHARCVEDDLPDLTKYCYCINH